MKSLASEGSGREAIVTLLIGKGDFSPGWDAAAPLIQAWADREPNHDVPPYLIGRNLFTSGRREDAARYLDQSLALEPRVASVRREALRLRLIAACALGDVPGVAKALERVVADPDVRTARRLGLERLAERCGLTLVASQKTTTAVLGAPERSEPKSSGKTPIAPSCPGVPVMKPLPGGKFWVGSALRDGRSPDESPRYLSELAPFCLDETEVTVKAYTACVSEGRCPKLTHSKILCNFGRDERSAHPMNCIDWATADAYCGTRKARLPSEVEFEYAARGGSEYRKYPWGDASPDGRACWKHNGSCEVKSFPAGAFGLFDVSGNVWEWTDDWYGPYPFPPEEAFAKVYRGGSFSRRFEKWMHTRLRDRAQTERIGSAPRVSLRAHARHGKVPLRRRESRTLPTRRARPRLRGGDELQRRSLRETGRAAVCGGLGREDGPRMRARARNRT